MRRKVYCSRLCVFKNNVRFITMVFSNIIYAKINVGTTDKTLMDPTGLFLRVLGPA